MPISLASCERYSVMKSRVICSQDPRRMSRLSTGSQHAWELGTDECCPGCAHSLQANRLWNSHGLAGGLPLGKDPVGARKVTGVAVRMALQIVLVLRLGFPEVPYRRHLGDDLAGPQARGVQVGDRLLRHLLLLVAGIKDRRTVACADIVALTVPRRGVVDLEEVLEDAAVARLRRIKDDVDPFRMSTMVAVGRVRSGAAGITDASRDNAGKRADQVLHPPEAATSEYSALMHAKPP